MGQSSPTPQQRDIDFARFAQTAAPGQSHYMPKEYGHLAKRKERLGFPAFFAMQGIYYLIVNQPALW